MRSNEEKARRSTAFVIARGVFVGFVACGLLFAVAAFVVSRGILTESGMKPAAALAAFIAAGAGGCTAARGSGRRRLLSGAAAGGAMFVICAVFQLAIHSAGFPNAWTAALLGALVLGGMAGGMLSAASRPRRR